MLPHRLIVASTVNTLSQWIDWMELEFPFISLMHCFTIHLCSLHIRCVKLVCAKYHNPCYSVWCTKIFSFSFLFSVFCFPVMCSRQAPTCATASSPCLILFVVTAFFDWSVLQSCKAGVDFLYNKMDVIIRFKPTLILTCFVWLNLQMIL